MNKLLGLTVAAALLGGCYYEEVTPSKKKKKKNPSDPTEQTGGAGGSMGEGPGAGPGAGAGGGSGSGAPATGFATSPLSWATPAQGTAQAQFGFPKLGDVEPFAENNYATIDLTGDGKPDLVVTSEEGFAFGDPGQRYWLVYAGTDAGFSPNPVQWNTPASGAEQVNFGFPSLAATEFVANRYATTDITGDGKPDLVLTSDQEQPLGGPGQNYWLVYENTGSGFASAPSQWKTPSQGSLQTQYGFTNLAGTDDFGPSNYYTVDLTGDHRADLVITSEQHQPFGGGGPGYWLVYENTGSGFASTPTQWGTPTEGAAQVQFGFPWMSSPPEVGANRYATVDLTGDGKPDLVVTSESYQPLGGGGPNYWLVYPNTGSGFAGAPTQWPTPTEGAAQVQYGFIDLAASEDQAVNNYATMDLTGDHKPDLVLMSDKVQPLGQPGDFYWLVYANTGSGFAASPAQWKTPAEGAAQTQYGFTRTADFDPYAANNYTTTDLTGDGKPDLVLTSDKSFALGDPAGHYWLVFPAVP